MPWAMHAHLVSLTISLQDAGVTVSVLPEGSQSSETSIPLLQVLEWGEAVPQAGTSATRLCT